MNPKADVVVVGGGVIGCSAAYRLAQAGLQVVIVEKGRPGQEASWAAAGMLAPNADVFHAAPEPLARLCFESLERYPGFISELESDSGLKIGYRTTGSVCVAMDFAEAQMLAGLMERQTQAGRAIEEPSVSEMQKLLPGASNRIEAAVYLADDRYVDNRQLMAALTAACQAQSVDIVTETPVLSFIVEGGRAKGVRTPGGPVYGDAIILAAGCWSGLLAGDVIPNLPVRPIRGEIVCLQIQPQPFNHLIHSSGCYLVPWPDGRIVVGSTLENVGFDNRVTARGVRQLLNAAASILPGLENASLLEVWAGLRPGTPDDLPILGRTSMDNLIVASGHYRNGILLAPITAKLISELILENRLSKMLQPFHPNRFAKS